jgi:hypothetical protein
MQCIDSEAFLSRSEFDDLGVGRPRRQTPNDMQSSLGAIDIYCSEIAF